MLVSSQLSQVPTVENLVSLWADRYLPDLSRLPIGDDPEVRHQLREAASKQGRTQTAVKLSDKSVERSCKLAGIRVKDLYTNLPETLAFKEAVELGRLASKIYLKLLELYQTPPATLPIPKEALWETYGDSSLVAWGIPKIDKLAHTLEPLLLEFQEQHLISKDWQALGFITTQINFSNALLLEELSPVERVLISPYLNFLEEQVAVPWQRVCAVAAKHHLDSPAFALVKNMMPMTADVSLAVYERLYDLFPRHYSRRGSLSHAGVKHSCLRDFNMFQAYLWLCLLQGSTSAIQQELVALCVIVFESIGVPWKMVARANELILDEIWQRLNFEQQDILQPYIEGALKAFPCEQSLMPEDGVAILNLAR